MMKHVVFVGGVALVMTGLAGSLGCGGNDREAGICYCSYFSGESKQSDLKAMSESEQRAECERLDENANAFGGECDLEVAD